MWVTEADRKQDLGHTQIVTKPGLSRGHTAMKGALVGKKETVFRLLWYLSWLVLDRGKKQSYLIIYNWALYSQLSCGFSFHYLCLGNPGLMNKFKVVGICRLQKHLTGANVELPQRKPLSNLIPQRFHKLKLAKYELIVQNCIHHMREQRKE